jgi:LmbE family N-acetylglucosaminyl deacetylase
MSSVLYADIILLLLIAVAVIGCIVVRAPKPFRDQPRHVLICAAHSDDCVIVGAEYAYGAIQHGFSVRIAYLTCSGPDPDAEISRIRKMEALAAWSTLGVPDENFTFADLTQSPIGEPARYSDQDIARAKEIFKTLIQSLPNDAAVIVPAHGEGHVDHGTVRKICLEVILDSKRQDFIVYESPEYNGFLSVVHCPERTARTILRNIPLLGRLIKRYTGRSNYVSGPPGFVFRDTPKRLAKKKELLTYFSSQDGELLNYFFGYETPYRRVELSEYRCGSPRSFCVSAFGGCCDPSALALALAVIIIAFLTAHEIARGLTTALSPMFAVDKYLALLGGSLAIAYLVRKDRRTVNLEKSLFVWAAALGLISNAL